MMPKLTRRNFLAASATAALAAPSNGLIAHYPLDRDSAVFKNHGAV
ncbi:MAG: twin-arginine translocation signal domain-containing protein, partial [Bryobacteraceae bacterium]|nr:twin-arginine translocation signal domain-containing protein [Bryobacteraceae bacterium]